MILKAGRGGVVPARFGSLGQLRVGEYLFDTGPSARQRHRRPVTARSRQTTLTATKSDGIALDVRLPLDNKIDE